MNNFNYYSNRSSGCSWWFRIGKIAGGGNGPEAVNYIRKTMLSVCLPFAIAMGATGLGLYATKKWIDKRFKDDNNRNTGDAENPLSPSPIDEEKAAKEEDRRVKNEICKRLGLFDPESPKPTRLTPNSMVGNAIYKLKKLVGNLIKQGDRVVVVSAPGVGKSNFCVQTGLAISEGRRVEYLPEGSYHAEPQNVYYYDGELDEDDIMQRYGNRECSEKYVRYPASKFRTEFYLLQHIYDISNSLKGSATFILDNLYALMPTMKSENTRTFLDGLDVIQRRALEKGFPITIIIVTHTKKDFFGVPQLSDVAGSAHISRFAKSELSLAALPGDDNLVALVTNKKRWSEIKDAYIMKLKDADYLHFKYIETVSNAYIDSLFRRGARKGANCVNKTHEHTTTNEQSDDLVQQMQALRDQNLSDRAIARILRVSAPTVRNMIGSNGNGHHNGGRRARKH